MILCWIEPTKSIRIEFSDGEILEFPCNLWNRTGLDKEVWDKELDSALPADIFKSYNLWWVGQPPEVENKAKQLYKEVVNVFSQELSADKNNKALYTTVEQIIRLHAWDSFRRFYVDEVRLNFDIYAKEKLESNDTSIDTTYFTADSIDLVVFSILIKALMPIWGMYYYNYKTKLGSEFAMLYSIYLVRSEALTENPAWKKLELLIHTVAGKKIKANYGYSITNDIGSEEQPDLIMALILLKKVCNFDPMVVGESVIRNVYALLRDRCDRISRGGPRNRRVANREGDALSVVDTYNIVKPQPPSVEVAVAHWVPLVKDILGISDRSDQIHEIMSNIIDIDDVFYHYQIIAMLVGPILGGRNLLLQRNDKLIELIAVTSVWLEVNGLHTLSELLILTPEEKNMNTISFSGTGQYPLSSKVQQELSDIYKHVYPKTPAEDLIAGIISYINGYNYKFVRGNICNLQTELAEMLIYHNTQMRLLEEKVYARRTD